MFENKLTSNGIHYTRYIASWRSTGGKIYRGGLFERWLKEKEQLTDDEIRDIMNLAETGKLELEDSAKVFMKENYEEQRNERKLSLWGGSFEDCQGTHIKRLNERYEHLNERYERLWKQFKE